MALTVTHGWLDDHLFPYRPPASPYELWRRARWAEWEAEHRDEQNAYYRAHDAWERECIEARREALIGRRLEAIVGSTLQFEGGAWFTPGDDYSDDEIDVPGLEDPPPPPRPTNPYDPPPGPVLDVSEQIAMLEPSESPLMELLWRLGPKPWLPAWLKPLPGDQE
jgi:hypothetical protein